MRYTTPHHVRHVLQGFTLVETLVAISIIMIALVAPFQTVEHALTAAYVSRDELAASSLAQEGVEYVLNIRDSNYLNNLQNGTSYTWLYGLDGSGGSANCIAATGATNRCIVDPIQKLVQACTSATCPTLPLYIGSTGSSYPYTYNQAANGTASKFLRTVSFCYMQTGGTCTATLSNEAKLTVTVTWSTNNTPYSTTITEYLDNWL